MFISFPFSRLFSCGTSEEGDSYLVEWNESEGSVKRSFLGFRKKSPGGVVQFDTTQNHFLAAGDNGQIKFWDMENISVIATTDADGGLQVIFVNGLFIFYGTPLLFNCCLIILIATDSSSPEIQQGRESSCCYHCRQWIQDTCKRCRSQIIESS